MSSEKNGPTVRFEVSKLSADPVDENVADSQSQDAVTASTPSTVETYQPTLTPPMSPRFVTSSVVPNSAQPHHTFNVTPRPEGPTEQPAGSEAAPFMADHGGPDFALYDDEADNRPKIGHVFRSLSIYNPIMPGTSKFDKEAKKAAGAQMGTFMGVFLPCIQNIFGVLFFIRLSWIVGTAGVLQGFAIVLICCCVTFLTAISLSAIATNGMVPGGGPYYMISRNLGPELGGAVGILFYLGTSVAASMYIVGAVEIFVFYLFPAAKIFDNVDHCSRLFGTILLITLGLIVTAGVRVVNKFALPAVAVVVLCIFLTFLGIFIKFNGSDELQYCQVGDRLVNVVKLQAKLGKAADVDCNFSNLTHIFCEDTSDPTADNCEPYFHQHREEIGWRRAISGISSNAFIENFGSKYLSQLDLVVDRNGSAGGEQPATSSSDPGTSDLRSAYVFADVTTSFMILVGVFFPSCTGIMAGSNRSGDLKDASLSIPRGTLAANLFTSTVYLLGVILFGASVDEMFIRDKFGESANGRLIIANLAVPHNFVILVGCFFSTVGAGMQSLTGAPRLFQAIAKDGVIPILQPFQVSTRHGEPLRAILLTLSICEIGILIAKLENITALITQFFLMCYLSVNTACALQSVLNSPGWRPRFRYYHWFLSTCGAVLCVAVMFISHWIFALFSIAIGVVVYKYIEYRGAEKEWGDGLRGLGLAAARYSLLSLEDKPMHTKNWRPQLLVLIDGDPVTQDKEEEKCIDALLAFVSQLKAGKGLTVLAAVIEGDYVESDDRAEEVKQFLRDEIKRNRIRGFCDVMITSDKNQGISAIVQTSGLGCMRHNAVVCRWPDHWKENEDWAKCREFVTMVRVASAAKCAILVPKNVQSYPLSGVKMTGHLDVWWVVHDGGMLMLLPFLLRQHRTWKNTKLRIFTVAQMEDNSVKMKEDLKTFLYHLRIDADVNVIEMPESDISEYTYERTLVMEQRFQILQNMQLSKKQMAREVQSVIMDEHHPSERKQTRTYDETQSAAIAAEQQEQVAAQQPGTPDRKISPTGQTPTPPSTTTTDGSGTRRKSSTFTKTPVVTFEMKPTDDSDEGEAKDQEPNHQADEKRLSDGSVPTIPRVTIGDAVDVEENGVSRLLSDEPQRSTTTMPAQGEPGGLPYAGLKPYNVRRMHTAIKLNELMRGKSCDAQLLIVNLPGPPKHGSDQYYMEFIEALTEGLDRVLLVKGTGTEVVTIYS